MRRGCWSAAALILAALVVEGRSSAAPDSDLVAEGSGCVCSTPGIASRGANDALLVVGAGAAVIALRRRRRG